MNSDREYIGNLNTIELSRAVNKKMNNWYLNFASTPIVTQWMKNFELYYNSNYNIFSSYPNASAGFGVTADGKYVNYKINELRNVLLNQLNMAFAKPPALKCVASNSDADALSQIALCDTIVEHTMKVKKTMVQYRMAAEIGLITGTGAIFKEWDFFGGDPYTAVDGTLINAGDIRTRYKSPLEFLTDLRTAHWEDVLWVIVVDYYNKYELASKFPEYYDRIVRLSTESKYNNRFYNRFFYIGMQETDMLPVFKFFHKPVPGFMPQGRYALIADDDLCPIDMPYPYGDTLPLFLCKPMEWIGTTYGQTVTNDLAPVQYFKDLVTSALATNVAHFGVPNIIAEQGSGVDLVTLSSGANVYEYKSGMAPPQVLNLMQISPEMFTLDQLTSKAFETLSGINSVVRGDPEHSLKSGAALGVIQSQAIMFSSGFQQAVNNLYEDGANFDLQLFKRYADVDRVVSIVGKNKITQLRNWNKKDISNVSRVYIENQDPMSQSVAGRMAMADNLLQHNKLANAQEYVTVATTGQLEPIYKREMDELNYIHTENQELLEGKQCRVLVTDTHPLHISEHECLTYDVDLRNGSSVPNSPEAIKLNNILMHIQEHKNQEMALQQLQMQNQLASQQQMAPAQSIHANDGVQQFQKQAA